MRHLLVTAAAVLLALPLSSTAADAAKPKMPKADLVVWSVAASLSGRTVSVQVTVANKGKKKKAKASSTSLLLSRDGTPSSDDASLGSLPTGKLKARKSRTLTTSAVLPPTASGSYVVIACADSARAVKEKKEANNCAASAVITTATVQVSASAGANGTIAASGVSGGTCTGSPTAQTCSLSSGASSVTFTPTAAPGFIFDGWSGSSCGGVTGADGALTFVNPTASGACTASFAPKVTVTYVAGTGASGPVTTAASGGASCLAGGNGGTCVTKRGAGTITLTAPPPATGYIFLSWSGDSCPASSPGQFSVTINDPTADGTCTASYFFFALPPGPPFPV